MEVVVVVVLGVNITADLVLTVTSILISILNSIYLLLLPNDSKF